MSPFVPQRQTISAPCGVAGIGLHSGVSCRVQLAPAASGRGLVLNGTRLGPDCLESGRLATTVRTLLGPVSTVEHLFAALVGQGIDDVEVTVEGGEVPILDGSAEPWLQYLTPTLALPARPADVMRLDRVIEIHEGPSSIYAEPAAALSIDIVVAYPTLGEFEYTAQGHEWVRAAPARTFGFIEDHESLLAMGLARGANLDNTLVFGLDGQPLNAGGARMVDEVARHKWLDCLGDLALLDSRLLARVRAVRAGHRLHHRLVMALAALSGQVG